MATSKAYTGQGFAVYVGTEDAVTTDAAADTFIEIAEVNDIKPPSLTVEQIEVSHLKSTIKERIAGLPDGGTGTLACNMINDDPGQKECKEALEAREMRNFRFVFPTTMEPNQLDVKAIVTAFDVNAPTNNVVSLSIGLAASSAAVWS